MPGLTGQGGPSGGVNPGGDGGNMPGGNMPSPGSTDPTQSPIFKIAMALNPQAATRVLQMRQLQQQQAMALRQQNLLGQLAMGSNTPGDPIYGPTPAPGTAPAATQTPDPSIADSSATDPRVTDPSTQAGRAAAVSALTGAQGPYAPPSGPANPQTGTTFAQDFGPGQGQMWGPGGSVMPSGGDAGAVADFASTPAGQVALAQAQRPQPTQQAQASAFPAGAQRTEGAQAAADLATGGAQPPKPKTAQDLFKMRTMPAKLEAQDQKQVPPRVIEGAKQVALKGSAQDVFDFMRQQGYPKSGAWCGEFAAAVVKASGGQPPASPAVASNWRTYGTPVQGTPQPGDVAVRKGGATGDTGSHVTFVTGVNPDGTFSAKGGNQAGGQLTTSTYRQGDYDFRRPDVDVKGNLAYQYVDQADRAIKGDAKSREVVASTPAGKQVLEQAADMNLNIRTAVRYLMERNPNMRPEDLAGALFGNKSFIEVMNKDSQLQIQALKAEQQQKHQDTQDVLAQERATERQRADIENEKLRQSGLDLRERGLNNRIQHQTDELNEKRREFEEKQKSNASALELRQRAQELARLTRERQATINEYDRMLGISGSVSQAPEVRKKAADIAKSREGAAKKAQEDIGKDVEGEPPDAGSGLKPVPQLNKDAYKAITDPAKAARYKKYLEDQGYDTSGL